MKGRGRKPVEDELSRLRRRAEESLKKSLDPSGVLPLLHQLARVAHPASADAAFAHQQLAELLAEIDPWRSALFARRVILHHPDNDRAWAALALTQSILENFRFARRAYERALELSPRNPSYAHNLGHLLDVALRDPEAAVGWLGRAYQWAKNDPTIAASYAHALGRSGRWRDAARVLKRAVARDIARGNTAGTSGSSRSSRGARGFHDSRNSRELAALGLWVQAGLSDAEPGSVGRPSSPAVSAPFRPVREPKPGRRSTLRGCALSSQPEASTVDELDRALRQGLSRLPFSAEQRSRARELARDAAEQAKLSPAHLRSDSLAAAVAYAIVYIDEVPLTHAEVAAPFRVRVAQLRGCFAELRAELSLVRGDMRYAT